LTCLDTSNVRALVDEKSRGMNAAKHAAAVSTRIVNQPGYHGGGVHRAVVETVNCADQGASQGGLAALYLGLIDIFGVHACGLQPSEALLCLVILGIVGEEHQTAALLKP